MSDTPSPDSTSGTSEPKTLTLALVRRNPWFLGLAALPLLTAIAFLVVGIYSAQWLFLMLIPHSLILAGALGAMLWIRNPRPREIEGAVSVSEEGVHINKMLALPREQIKAGFVVPRPDKRPIVRIEKKGLPPATEIRVENEDEGREVLRRLGLDATQTIASFVLPSRLFVDDKFQKQYLAIFSGAIVLSAVVPWFIPLHVGITPIFIMLASMSFAATALLTRTHLRIGADGIVIKWFRTERFIPHDEIASIESYEETRFQRRRWAGVRVHLQSGEIITLPIASAGDVGGPRVRLVKHRLEQAHADHQRGVRASAEARLMRGERPMLAWVRELRRAGAGAAANHRIAPMPTDRLLELVEDPHADPVMRANAAVALGANTESREIQTRLRVAARATAAPRLRVALEKAVDVDDEAALAEALAEVEGEAKKTLPNQ